MKTANWGLRLELLLVSLQPAGSEDVVWYFVSSEWGLEYVHNLHQIDLDTELVAYSIYCDFVNPCLDLLIYKPSESTNYIYQMYLTWMKHHKITACMWQKVLVTKPSQSSAIIIASLLVLKLLMYVLVKSDSNRIRRYFNLVSFLNSFIWSIDKETKFLKTF